MRERYIAAQETYEKQVEKIQISKIWWIIMSAKFKVPIAQSEILSESGMLLRRGATGSET
jgi:hypothetical protein